MFYKYQKYNTVVGTRTDNRLMNRFVEASNSVGKAFVTPKVCTVAGISG